MKQVFIPYTEWEDFLNGMWRKLPKEDESDFINRAVVFTSDHIKYGEAMGEVIPLWPNTMLNSLTNISLNRKAFLGHCACAYKINCPEYITRIAWSMITEQQRVDANKIANIHIINYCKEHERKNRKIHNGLGNQMLFQWNT